MKKILLSVATIAFAGAAVAGLSGAFYKDVETSTGNTFTAGGLELKVDSESHYNGMVCTDMGDVVAPRYQWQIGASSVAADYPAVGSECNGTWAETNLVDGVHKFFYFTDLKPGDSGEDTISLHVYDNDAWGQFVIDGVVDQDNSCTDPEQEAEDGACDDPTGDGEIDDYLTFTGWLDQGSTPGFQGKCTSLNTPTGCDPTEGDNIFQNDGTEGKPFWDNKLISNLGPFDLADVFKAAYGIYCVDDEGAPLYDPNGDNDYGECHGFAEDGRMVKSTTYYFGLAWDFPLETDNDAQTDEYTADMTFRVEQHRNNPTPFQLD